MDAKAASTRGNNLTLRLIIPTIGIVIHDIDWLLWKMSVRRTGAVRTDAR